MTGPSLGSLVFATLLLQAGLALAIVMLIAVVLERVVYAIATARQRRIDHRYESLVRHALDGDDAAVRALVASPRRHRLAIAYLVLAPFITDRDGARIARTRAVIEALSIRELADRFTRSIWWWKRAIGLRGLGLMQARDRTAVIVGALDDEHPDVRAAALDALTDLQDPQSLQAVVVRLHDSTLHRGRRAAALLAFGEQCEPFLLDLAAIDPARRVNYARALARCGTARSRPALCAWARDSRAPVRTAAFEALAHVGLDDEAARLALGALDDDEPSVCGMAAHALRGWAGAADAVPALVRRLDGPWTVAVQAARSLRSIRPSGLAALGVCAERGDLAGILARQMLWEEQREL